MTRLTASSVLLTLVVAACSLGCTGVLSGDPKKSSSSNSATAGAGGSAGSDGAVAAGGSSGSGGDTGLPPDDAPVDFFRDIQPILTEQCVRCHGGVRELGKPELNLQSRERAAFTLGVAG